MWMNVWRVRLTCLDKLSVDHGTGFDHGNGIVLILVNYYSTKLFSDERQSQ